MPVHSKPLSVRARNNPPLLGPKPYKKCPQNTWKTQESPCSYITRPSEDLEATPSVTFSVLRRPCESQVRTVPKSPQIVRFGSAEILGIDTHEYEEDIILEDSPEPIDFESGGQPDDFGGSSAAAGQTTLSLHNLNGAQALRDCEEHTDWANEVLGRNNLPLISDLRKSIGDGYTLPTILEIIAGVSLSCVKTKPVTKEERVLNILHCLKFLCRRGADITGIEPAQIEDGNLKAVLTLVGNIRQHFKNAYLPEQNGFSHEVTDSPGLTTKPPPAVRTTMPGAMKLPGAVPTPFLPPDGRNNIADRGRKNSHHDEQILPGVMATNASNSDPSKHNYNIISTTEIGMNGVAQHGVEERKHHFAKSNPTVSVGANRGMVIRHPNARTTVPGVQEGLPPTVTQRAWTGSPRPQTNHVNGNNTSPSVEDRLKNLLGSGSSHSGSRDNLGYYGGGFHAGSSEILDDDEGEYLVVPKPKTRNSPDFELGMLGDGSYGPGYRPLTSQHQRQQSQQGYVPSKPSERVQGSRAEVIISRPPSAIAFRKSAPRPDNLPGSAIGNGQESSPYLNRRPASTELLNRGNGALIAEPAYKTPGRPKAVSNDLRNAWNKLYGPQAQVPTSYGGTTSPGLRRGDPFRNSYGQQNPNRLQNNDGQHNVTTAQPSAPMFNRPVSAPAPAHMQAFFQAQDRLLSQGQGQSHSQDHLDNQGQGHSYTSHHRESPMGQSSSTQGHLDESSSSQQSHLSQDQVPKHLQIQTSTDNNYGKLSHSSHSSLSQPSPSSPGSQNFAIGPASKYPDNPGSRPSSARRPSGLNIPQSPSNRQNRPRLPLPHQRNDIGNRSENRPPGLNISSDRINGNAAFDRNKLGEELMTSLQAASKEHKNTHSNFEEYNERSHDMSMDFQNHSIFDYPSRSESTGSVTPPLPPLSPTNSPPDSPGMEGNLARSISATNVSSAAKEEVDCKGEMRKQRRTSELNFRTERQSRGRKGKKSYRHKGANLHDVKESGTDTESNLSFDIDDTILTVESHDTEHHPAGDILSSREVITLRNQLHDLENKYHNLQHKVSTDRPVGHHLHTHLGPGKGPGLGPPPIGRQRRWSIGSSDTSSFRREAKYKPGRQAHHKHHSKEFKNINKRFQRLESHVVTLARSVAHLSSELRTHNTMVNDLETVKRELRELRENPSRPFPNMIDRTMAEQERFRDWVPSLTNPKRVNKLTKFFGMEPPLLELFLKQLGYEKYVPNFQSEHIGMIELPYMTEDRLEKIGVPMGPRIRILQEAQSCFRQENLNVYLV